MNPWQQRPAMEPEEAEKAKQRRLDFHAERQKSFGRDLEDVKREETHLKRFAAAVGRLFSWEKRLNIDVKPDRQPATSADDVTVIDGEVPPFGRRLVDLTFRASRLQTWAQARPGDMMLQLNAERASAALRAEQRLQINAQIEGNKLARWYLPRWQDLRPQARLALEPGA